MKWIDAPEIKSRIDLILVNLKLPHVLGNRLIVYRSFGSKGRAIARIWSLPHVWQQALGVAPHYVIEVISERFDRLDRANQDRTLIHELMHIPKTFSGALVSHRTQHHRIDQRTVEVLYQQFLKNLSS